MALHQVMRFVGDPVTGGGLTIYAVISGADSVAGAGQVWRVSTNAFETCSGANWADYGNNVLSQSCAGIYSALLPAGLRIPNRVYDISYYKQTGGTRDIAADVLVGASTLHTGDNRLQLTLEGSTDCVVPNDTITFIATFQDVDGQVAPDATPTVTAIGGGSVAIGAVGANVGIFRVTYTAPAGAGVEAEVTVSANKTYGSSPATVINRTAAVPVKVCETGSAAPTAAQNADAVWYALRAQDSAAAPWPANSMGASVNVTSSGLATDAISSSQISTAAVTEIVAGVWGAATKIITGFANGAITTTSFSAGAIDANSLAADAVTEITTGVDSVLTLAHGAGNWGGGGGSGVQTTED